MAGICEWRYSLKALLLIILMITITGPEIVCLAGKPYFVSPKNEYPILLTGEDGKPLKCEEIPEND